MCLHLAPMLVGGCGAENDERRFVPGKKLDNRHIVYYINFLRFAKKA